MSTELLSPAGSLKSMRYAFAYGADAVYAGQPRYSLRVRNNEFSKAEVLQAAITEAHGLGKHFYLASNLAPHNDKVKTYLRDLTPIIAMQPDALIMSDPGLIMMVREAFPEMPVHLSVQANVVNYASARFWQRQGIERIILSRELSLDEIEEIKQRCPELELEVFVHGALCIAYSGRCLLSGYMNHRDSNQGACTNACRWQYKTVKGQDTPEGEVIAVPPVKIEHPSEEVYLLQEATRPNELMPMFEDEHGTYIMNSKDLRAVQHVERLVKIGVDSIKIEGRTKSFFYAARTAQVYRRAVDDVLAGREFDMRLLDTLDGLANRGFTEGFLRRHVPRDLQNYTRGSSVSNKQKFVGEVIDYRSGRVLVEVKNHFEIGDELEFMTPKGNACFELRELYDREGNPVAVAPGSGHQVWLPVADGVDTERALLIRNLKPEMSA